jgi:trehalose 6-phosphate phosphatase
MEHLLTAWSYLEPQLKNASCIVILADYDGTLTPIMPRPELAIMSPDTREVLKDLSGRSRIRIGIISGRSLANIKQLVGLDGIIYAGNHGLEIDGMGINFKYPVDEYTGQLLNAAADALNQALSAIPGVIVENKGLTLSIHFRQVARDRVTDVKRIVDRITSDLQTTGKARFTSGKQVIEIGPAVEWNKGKAVQLIMEQYSKTGNSSGTLPIYFGDDLTDENAFKKVNKYTGGITVYIGDENSATGADYFLNSAEEVNGFLKKVRNL